MDPSDGSPLMGRVNPAAAGGLFSSPFVFFTGIFSAVMTVLLLASLGTPWETETFAGYTTTSYPFRVCVTAGSSTTCSDDVSSLNLKVPARAFITGIAIANAIAALLGVALTALAGARLFAPGSRASEVLASQPVLFSLALILALGLFSCGYAASIQVAKLVATAIATDKAIGRTADAASGVYLTCFAFIFALLAACSAWNTPRDEITVEEVFYEEAPPAPPPQRRAPVQQQYMQIQQQQPQGGYAPYQQQQQQGFGPSLTAPSAASYAPPQQRVTYAPQGMPPPAYAPPQPMAPKFMSGPTASGGAVVPLPVFGGSSGSGASGPQGIASRRGALVARAAASVGASAGDVASEGDVMHLLTRARSAVERACTDMNVDLNDDEFSSTVVELMRSVFDRFSVPPVLAVGYLSKCAQAI